MNQKQIGTFIADLRKQKGMTQVQLAQIMHVSDRTISKWENGRGLPDPSNLMLLAQILEISLNELLSAKIIENDMEYRKKAEENILSVLVSQSVMETMSLFSILVMIICVIPVIYISSFGFQTSGWVIGVSGLSIIILSACQYHLIHKNIPQKKVLHNIFIKVDSDIQIPESLLHQVGTFETYGSKGYRGFTTYSTEQIRKIILENTVIPNEQIEVFSSPTMWTHRKDDPRSLH